MSDPSVMSVLVPPVAAFVLVVLLIMPLRKLAFLSGVVDRPGGRKQHDRDVPPVGGMIVFCVFMALGLVFEVVDLVQYWPLYTGLILLLVGGTLDDQFHIPPFFKMGLHVAVAVLIAFWGNVEAAYLGDLFGFGIVWTGFLSYPLTVVAIVLLINAMNLMDGMDGLTGGVFAVILSWFLLAAVMSGWYDYAHILVLLIACIAGFLVFNMRNPWRRKASLFLGDAGSMCVGLTIAWFAVLLARTPQAPLEPIAVAWIIGFPVFDTCAQFYRRVREGRHPFSPDRGHFHHHFIDAGVPVRYASPIIIALIGVMGGIGYGGIMLGVPPVLLTVGWVMLLVTHIAISQKPGRYVRIIQRCLSVYRSIGKQRRITQGTVVTFLCATAMVCFSGYRVEAKASEKAETRTDMSVLNPIAPEALLDAHGNWDLVEQSDARDPTQAHLSAREKVDIKRRKNMDELSPHFRPDAKSGQDGKVRILRLKSETYAQSAVQIESESDEVDRQFVDSARRFGEKNALGEIRALLAQKMPSGRRSAAVIPPVPDRKPDGAGALASAVRLRSGKFSGGTRIAIDVTHATRYRVLIDSTRRILTVKLESTRWTFSPQERFSKSALLGTYIATPQDDNSTVLEVRLKKRTDIRHAALLLPDGRPESLYRLVIDLED